MLVQSGQIPQILVPWLALVLIILCIWILIQVTWDMKKNGVSKAHARIFTPTLATILVLGFGQSVVTAVMTDVQAAQDAANEAEEKAEKAGESGEFLRSVLGLIGGQASAQALDRTIGMAKNDEDRMLAVRMFAQQNPESTKTWLKMPKNRTLFALPENIATLDANVEQLIAENKLKPARLPGGTMPG